MADGATQIVAAICAVQLLVSLIVGHFLLRANILDIPNERSSHGDAVPRIGGLAIIASFFVGFAALNIAFEFSAAFERLSLGLAAGCAIISIAGLLDDVGMLRSPLHKLVMQLLAAATVLAFGVWFRRISLPVFGSVELGWAGPILTIMWLVGLTNAVNFMDGLNGLAGGTCAIAAGFFAFAAYQLGGTGWSLLAVMLVPGILGFLWFNFPKGSIFMGDVGSQFLGFVLAALAVFAANSDVANMPIYVMPLLFFHFIFDTCFTFARRLILGEKVSQAHRSHLYQLVNRLGRSHGWVSLLHLALAILQGLGALTLIRWPIDTQVFVFAPFIVLETIYATIVIRLAGRHGLLRIQSE